MPRKKASELEHICCQCGESDVNKFYKSNSPVYANKKLLPLCKNCATESFQKYYEKYGDLKKAIKRMCMSLDLYYSEKLVISLKDSDVSSLFGNYVRMLNMQQYNKKSFENNLEEGFLFGTYKKKAGGKANEYTWEDDAEEISQEDVDKWGAGFEAVDYRVLNSHYALLKSANPNCDSNQEIFINDLCYTKMQQMKAVREGKVDDYNKLTDSYRKSFTQAGLKTVKDSSQKEDFTFGVNAEMIEKYTPAEYYKDKKLYKDYDNIGEYIERFLLRPLRNLMHGTKERDYEYYVKEESNEDEYTEN